MGYGWFERTISILLGLTLGTAYYHIMWGAILYWFSMGVLVIQIGIAIWFIVMFITSAIQMRMGLNKTKKKTDKIMKQLDLPEEE